MAHFRSKIAIFRLFSLLKTTGTIKKTSKWMILRVLAQFLLPFRYIYFLKILDFIFGQKWHILGQKSSFSDYFLFETSCTIKKQPRWMILRVLAQFFTAFQIKIFLKILYFIWGFQKLVPEVFKPENSLIMAIFYLKWSIFDHKCNPRFSKIFLSERE